MNKIQRASHFLLWIFRILMIYLPISLILFWVDAPTGIIRATVGDGWASIIGINYMASLPPVLHTLSATTKALGFAVSLIPFLINMFTLYFLMKLFSNYASLNIFSLINARYIKRIGCIILLGQILQPIHGALLSMAMTWNNPPSHRLMTITVDKSNIALIVCAIMIILVSWVMTEAYKEQETAKLII